MSGEILLYVGLWVGVFFVLVLVLLVEMLLCVLWWLFGYFLIGVVIVCVCDVQGKLVGLIINLFVLVLLQLLLVLWNLVLYVQSLFIFQCVICFVISVLVVDQEVLVWCFVDLQVCNCFDGLVLQDDDENVLLCIVGVVVYFICMCYVQWLVGDYLFLVGCIIEVYENGGVLLLFYCGWFQFGLVELLVEVCG